MTYPKKNSQGLRPFGTLEKVNNIKLEDRWYPTAVTRFELLFGRGILDGMPKDLRKNIAYSLQYLEYLEIQVKELKLSSVIYVMIYKNYIITSMAIIEGIFNYILKATGNWKQKEWELVKTINSNPVNCFEENIKIETNIYKKIDKFNDSMDFESMIKKMETKKLLDIPHDAFPYIKRLKRLRNKVHIQINDYDGDNDWNTFQKIDYLWVKYILYTILTNKNFDNKAVVFILDELKPSTEEIEDLRVDNKSKKKDN